ncbi:hypothetical protein TNCV_4520211 [Trichonephila clavipes]|nr:hypothetical protein TNCV_4520211 [Trichonephila clavipes]
MGELGQVQTISQSVEHFSKERERKRENIGGKAKECQQIVADDLLAITPQRRERASKFMTSLRKMTLLSPTQQEVK